MLITSHVPESWENKSKFPPNLKPLVAKLAIQAIRLDEYDEHFFNLMPYLFPYNRFTMSVGFPHLAARSPNTYRLYFFWTETYQTDYISRTCADNYRKAERVA
jgi:hypothetical protein